MTQIAALPQVLVEVDGSTLDDDVMRELALVRVRQRLAAPAQCELTFHGQVDTALPTAGSLLRVAVSGRDAPLFAGQVTAVEHVFGPDRDYGLIVRAYDPLHRLRKRQRARALVQTTVEEIANDLAGDLGLSVDAAESGPSGRTSSSTGRPISSCSSCSPPAVGCIRWCTTTSCTS